MDDHCWDRELLEEFRIVTADGTIEEIAKEDLRARIERFSSEVSRTALRKLFRGETDEVTLGNGDRYQRIAWPELFE